MMLDSVFLRRLAAVGVAAGVVTLSACTPVDFDAQARCEWREGRYECTATATPGTPPPTTPPPTTPPPTAPPPADPNAGKVAAILTVYPQDGKARVTWTTERTDITGWRIGRDGTDTTGTGPWSGEVSADKRDVTFGLLRNGTTYTITLTAHTAAGDLDPVSATVIPVSATSPTPPPASGDTAAARLGWGEPLPASDEFNYTGRPDSNRWHQAGECWAGHAGNGKRCASNSNVANGFLRQTGESNGDTGWLASKLDQRYGKWEARVRSNGEGAGNTYHPLLIIWPQSNRWPQDGEYDFWENRAPDGSCAGHFIHYPHPSNVAVQQEGGWCETPGVNLNEWHNVAIEWTPSHIAGFIDGREVYRYSGGANSVRGNIQDMPSGHLTIQLDNFHGSGMQPATYDVDWVRIYR